MFKILRMICAVAAAALVTACLFAGIYAETAGAGVRLCGGGGAALRAVPALQISAGRKGKQGENAGKTPGIPFPSASGAGAGSAPDAADEGADGDPRHGRGRRGRGAPRKASAPPATTARPAQAKANRTKKTNDDRKDGRTRLPASGEARPASRGRPRIRAALLFLLRCRARAIRERGRRARRAAAQRRSFSSASSTISLMRSRSSVL